MIRQVELQDAKAITNIYNEYVLHSVATFDTEPVQEEEMRARIAEISSRFPYFVYEEDKEITGYCYAHTWKERSAYRYTLETTVYLSPGHTGKVFHLKVRSYITMNIMIRVFTRFGMIWRERYVRTWKGIYG